MRGFAQLLSGFLLEYVPRRRSLSENTAKSYRDSFAILLRWLADGRGIAPDDVRIEDLSRENVESFCLWLSDVRGVPAPACHQLLHGLDPPAFLQKGIESGAELVGHLAPPQQGGALLGRSGRIPFLLNSHR